MAAYSIYDTPQEVMIEYLLPLDGRSLQEACRSNVEFAKICRDEYFWKRKTRRDFGDIKMKGTWKKTWIDKYKRKYIEIEYDYELYNYDEDLYYEDENYVWYANPLPYRDVTEDEAEYLGKIYRESNERCPMLSDSLKLESIDINNTTHRITFTYEQIDREKNINPVDVVDEIVDCVKDYLEKYYNQEVDILPLSVSNGNTFFYGLKISGNPTVYMTHRGIKRLIYPL